MAIFVWDKTIFFAYSGSNQIESFVLVHTQGWQEKKENGDRTLIELYSLQQRYIIFRQLVDAAIDKTNEVFHLELGQISLGCDDLAMDNMSQNSNSNSNSNSNNSVQLIEKYFHWFMKETMEKNITEFGKFKNYMNHCYRSLYDPLFTNVFKNDIPMYYTNSFPNGQVNDSNINLNYIIEYAQAYVE